MLIDYASIVNPRLHSVFNTYAYIFNTYVNRLCFNMEYRLQSPFFIEFPLFWLDLNSILKAILGGVVKVLFTIGTNQL